MHRDEIERVLAELLALRPERFLAVYLFGSRARGTAVEGSDVDIAVLYADAPAPGLEGLDLDLEADIERALALPVQLIVLNAAPADLVHRVLRDGRLLIDRDPGRRIRFEVKARNEFFDLQPALARYRAARSPAR